jgi:hypothetical protein
MISKLRFYLLLRKVSMIDLDMPFRMISRRFRSVLRIETSVRFDVRAASLRLSRLEAMYHYAVQVEED